MGGFFEDTDIQDVGADADDCGDSINGFCVMQEAFGEKGCLVEGTFENVYIFAAKIEERGREFGALIASGRRC